MISSFSRPLLGDDHGMKEFEYITALHQTSASVQTNGLLSSVDVTRFFLSRLGFIISPETALEIVEQLGASRLEPEVVKDIILRKREEEEAKNTASSPTKNTTLAQKLQKSFRSSNRMKRRKSYLLDHDDDDSSMDVDQMEGGKIKNDEDEEELFLDMVQSLSILFIPTLVKSLNEYQHPPTPLKLPEKPEKYLDRIAWHTKVKRLKAKDDEIQSLRPPPKLFETSLDLLLAPIRNLDDSKHNNVHEAESNNKKKKGFEFPKLTSELVVQLLQAHGEDERAQNTTLVDAMVEAASTKNGDKLDLHVWVQALTSDVSLWDVNCEDRVSTHVYDVWGSDDVLFENSHQQYHHHRGNTARDLNYNYSAETTDVESPSRWNDTKEIEYQPRLHPFLEEEEEQKAENEANSLDSPGGARIADTTSERQSKGGSKDGNSLEYKDEEIEEYKATMEAVERSKTSHEDFDHNAETTKDDELRRDGEVLDRAFYRSRLVEIYQVHNPDKVKFVEQLLKKYKGRENQLFREISEKYNVDMKEMEALNINNKMENGLEVHDATPPVFFREEVPNVVEVPDTDSNEDMSIAEAIIAGEARNTTISNKVENHNSVNCHNIGIERAKANIDLVTDSHSSVLFAVTIWLFYISSTLLFSSLLLSLPNFQDACEPSMQALFGCQLLGKTYIWLLFSLILLAMGFIFVLPLSFGNNPVERSPKRSFIIACITILYCWFPYILIEWYEGQITEPFNKTENLLRSNAFQFLQNATQIFAGLVLIMNSKEFVVSAYLLEFGNSTFTKYFPSSDARGEFHAKKAATRKVNNMLKNATKLHTSDNGRNLAPPRGSRDTSLQPGEQSGESVAGFLWTWKMILTRKLFNTEGVWISSRTVIVQYAMLFVIVMLIIGSLSFIDHLAEKADQATRELTEYADIPQWVYDITPNGSQVRSSLIPAFVISTSVAIMLFLLYLPSYVSITLKYRCGVLESLKSDAFVEYRNKVDAVYTTMGSALFGLIGSTLLFFFGFGLIFFLFILPFSSSFMTALAAWVLGLLIAVCIKYAIESCWCRREGNLFKSFYRTQPNKSNVRTLALECWFLGLGAGVFLGRLAQFVLASAFWVGRVDVPLLSKEVEFGGYSFDFVPRNFVKGILVHEAHRHPYLERLLTMYMMKLKHGPKFGSEAGACWRQLFVVALLPWMKQNRVHTEERVAFQWEKLRHQHLQRVGKKKLDEKQRDQNRYEPSRIVL